jgi:uncharacterized membrane protein
LLLALGLRLNEMHGRSLWFDEAIEFNIAAHPLSEVIATDRASTHDPPLFSLALNLWMQAGSVDFQVRLLPVLASVLATAATFVLGRATFCTGRLVQRTFVGHRAAFRYYVWLISMLLCYY